MTSQSATATFHWRSLLGMSVGLFLTWGLVNATLAIYTPYTLHTGGVSALGGLVLMAESDQALLGRTFASIDAHDPRLAAYLVAFMDTMCAQMMGFAVAYTAVIWFGLRRAKTWALWIAAVAGVVAFAYYLPILDSMPATRLPPAVSSRFWRCRWPASGSPQPWAGTAYGRPPAESRAEAHRRFGTVSVDTV